MVNDPTGLLLIGRLHRLLERSPLILDAEVAFVETMTHFLARHGWGLAGVEGPFHTGILRAREYLEDDTSPNLSLANLADAVSLPPATLLRNFRRAFGCTPRIYLTARRLTAAKRALKSGAAIADAAAEFGFYDQSHLTRVLRRWTGATPRAFARHLVG